MICGLLNTFKELEQNKRLVDQVRIEMNFRVKFCVNIVISMSKKANSINHLRPIHKFRKEFCSRVFILNMVIKTIQYQYIQRYN